MRALVLLVLAGCGIDHHAFVCETDSECGARGRCEPEGFCAVEDASCAETGYRFVDSSEVPYPGSCTTTCAADVYAGNDTTCVRLTDGTVQCFGANATAQLGLGAADDEPHPEPAPAGGIFEGRAFSQLAIGGGHVCGLTGTSIACWGANDRRQVGGEPSAAELQPVMAIAGESVAAGGKHSCALEGGVVRCWGDNALGQLGARDLGVEHTSPVAVVRHSSALIGVLAIGSSASSDFTCASQSFFGCWGDDAGGQLGDGTTAPRDFYENFGNLSGGGLPLATGGLHACAAQPDATVACWGANDRGQLGNPSSEPHQSATRTAVALDVVALAAGDRYTCGLTRAGGQVICFGDHPADGTNAAGFVTVDGIADATSLAAGRAHSCVIAGGRVLCWGSNELGQLGDGTRRSRGAPRVAKLVCPR